MTFFRLSALLIVAITGINNSLIAQSDDQPETELEKINRELENPLAKRWSLVFQENYALNQGEAVDGTVSSNTFFFQPALPIPFGKNMVFTARPVFPIVTTPNFSSDATGGTSITGFGDIQMVTLLGPGNATGWIWGAGATFVFPTATDESIGNGKYQAGPALMVFHLSKTWTKGLFFQHWWSYAGNSNREDVTRTELQYIFRRNFGTWSLGMGPNISVNWEAEPENRLTFPIGLGYTRTVRIGNTPVKMRIEPQYTIIRPDNYGNVWNIRFQFAPVIKSPFIKK